MKSTVMAFSLFMQAISAALNLALTAVNTEDVRARTRRSRKKLITFCRNLHGSLDHLLS